MAKLIYWIIFRPSSCFASSDCKSRLSLCLDSNLSVSSFSVSSSAWFVQRDYKMTKQIWSKDCHWVVMKLLKRYEEVWVKTIVIWQDQYWWTTGGHHTSQIFPPGHSTSILYCSATFWIHRPLDTYLPYVVSLLVLQWHSSSMFPCWVILHCLPCVALSFTFLCSQNPHHPVRNMSLISS